ncbi:MAG: DNA polymerase III subunit beta [Candidatus Omnitrophica bacterium]|nr:DNA polymerase III subunit beta [Candidatus Omnitrophota bacterium]
MEFTIQREALLNGIQIVQNAITQKSSLPILSNILMEVSPTSVTLIATDLDMGISARVPLVSGDVGAITIPAKKFFDIIKSLQENSDVNIAIKKNNSISIRAGKAMFKIIGLPKEDFPELPMFEDKDSIMVEQKDLKNMITAVDFSSSKDDARHILTGVLFVIKEDELTMVTTDGRRMSLVTKKMSKKTLVDKKMVIPTKTIQEVKRLLKDEGEAKLQFNDNQIIFNLSNCFIISRLIEGEYPDYEKVIPAKIENTIKVDKNEFLDALKRVSILTDQDSQAIKINIQNKKITISKNKPYLEKAREEVNADYKGETEIEIGFNPKYLIDVLKNIEMENIEMEINGYNKPGVIRKEKEAVYVVLPMQIAS